MYKNVEELREKMNKKNYIIIKTTFIMKMTKMNEIR